MSIVSINGFKIIEEEVCDYTDIDKRMQTLFRDLGMPDLLSRFSENVEDIFGDATKVGFLSAYKEYIVPKNFCGLAVVKWITPERFEPYLDASDFCVPALIAQKGSDEYDGVSEALEESIRLGAEARLYAYELRESLKL